MKDIMRKHLWPASLVAALAVVGMLAAFVVLAGPERGTVEAQSACDTFTGPILAALIEAGRCPATTPAASPSPSPTTGAGGGANPGAPGSPGGGAGAGPTPVAPSTPEPDACSGRPPDVLAGLIAAGVCMEPTATPTITPTPTATPTATPVPTAGPTPTAQPTAQPPQNRDVPDGIESSSTSANAGVKLTLTIGNLPMDMLGGSSVELYLEDDFDVPDTINRGSVYFTVENQRTDATSNGSRVYATDPIEIDTDGHFTDDKDDYAIQVVLPDFNTADRPQFDGFQGPVEDQTLTVVFTKSAGIKNPSEEGTHSVGYAVLGPNDPANDGPDKKDGEIRIYKDGEPDPTTDSDGAFRTAPLNTYAKIALSDVDNKRGYMLTVTGSGFNNGTSAALHVLADPDTTNTLAAWVNGIDANDDGDTSDPGDTPPTAATKAQACGVIIREGHRVGTAEVGTDDTVAIEVEVTAPIFRPGNVNFLCMVDGEGRSSRTDVEDFKLEPSIRVSPSSATVGDTITVFAQDFPSTPGKTGFTELRIANQVVNGGSVDTVRVNADSIGTDGSATATFTLPGSVANSALEGTIRIDAKWGDTDEDAKINVTGSTLRLSLGEVRANDSLTITGEGFGKGSGVSINPDDITMDGVSLLVDDDSLTNDNVDVSNAGQFVATVYVWPKNRDASNPALTSGTHTIRVNDSSGYYGTATLVIKEPSITVQPETARPRGTVKITGADWPVDNVDSEATLNQVKITVEEREYTVIPDVTGRFSVTHTVRRNVGIPSTNQIKAQYGTEIVKVGSFSVPAAIIEVSPTEGQPGDEITLSVEGMPVWTEVEEITIGGASVGSSQDLRTDRSGDLTAEGIAIPGLDAGTYSVVLKVGTESNQTVAIGSITVLPEGGAGAVAMLPGALSELGDNLEAVFYFDNVSKEWSFYDPREDFADLNTLSGMIDDEPYWILVGEAVDEVVLNDNPRDLTCSNGDCWNLVVW